MSIEGSGTQVTNATLKLRKYMKALVAHGGSDLHIKANSQVRARINGDIVIVSKDKLTKEEALAMAKEILGERFEEFVERK